MQRNTKAIGSMSLIEMTQAPIGDFLDYLNALAPSVRESIGHAVALACYLELSK